jgi:hypothetical protein
VREIPKFIKGKGEAAQKGLKRKKREMEPAFRIKGKGWADLGGP